MKKESDSNEEIWYTLKIHGGYQVIKSMWFVGEIKMLQQAVDFLLEEVGTSEEEIKRLLSIGVQKVNLEPPKTNQQALDQLAWLIIIRGKLNDICDRVILLKGKISPIALKKILMRALDISNKIFKIKLNKKSEEAIIDDIIMECLG